jgi:short-subunit dehydrogenase
VTSRDIFGGKTAIVTGGSSGIGLALSKALARRGTYVVLASRTEDKVRTAVESLHSDFVEGYVLDVRQRESFRQLIVDLESRRRSVDFLFNSAGVAVIGELRDHTEDDVDDLIDINLRGVFNGIAAVYPKMIERGSGHIINISSVGGFLATPYGAAYTATKFGIVGLSQALRMEAERYGVTVTVACPGRVATDMAQSSTFRHIDRVAFITSMTGPEDSAEHCAESILRGVERRQAMITPHAASIISLLHRYLPFVTHRMMRNLAKRRARLRDGYSDKQAGHA